MAVEFGKTNGLWVILYPNSFSDPAYQGTAA
jgi:hypothetical protein